MVPHAKESPIFTFDLEMERQALLTNKSARHIPSKTASTLLAATWNMTNFGLQKRSDDDLSDLRKLMAFLPNSYAIIISDIGGNAERAGFIYDSSKLERLELAAEVAVAPSQQRYIRMKGVSGTFSGFARNPYAVAFKAGAIAFTAVSAHLFFGSHTYYNEDRRTLETYALARWTDQRHKSSGAYSKNILVMGDLNLPIPDKSSSVYRALKAKRLILPKHSTSMGSNLAGNKAYDQVAFHARGMQNFHTDRSGVLDFDRAPFFSDAWSISKEYFNAAVKYHIADPRPLWVEFNI